MGMYVTPANLHDNDNNVVVFLSVHSGVWRWSYCCCQQFWLHNEVKSAWSLNFFEFPSGICLPAFKRCLPVTLNLSVLSSFTTDLNCTNNPAPVLDLWSACVWGCDYNGKERGLIVQWDFTHLYPLSSKTEFLALPPDFHWFKPLKIAAFM